MARSTPHAEAADASAADRLALRTSGALCLQGSAQEPGSLPEDEVNSRAALFRIAALLFTVAAVYHLAVYFHPEFGEHHSPLRHVAFCFIDLAFAALLLARPRWLWYPYAALTVETFVSHGGRAWAMWRTPGRLDWFSILVILGVGSGFYLVLTDVRARRISRAS